MQRERTDVSTHKPVAPSAVSVVQEEGGQEAEVQKSRTQLKCNRSQLPEHLALTTFKVQSSSRAP